MDFDHCLHHCHQILLLCYRLVHEFLQEIKRQIPDMDNNIISKSISIDDQTKLDILLLKNNDTILIKP
jgi:hypothetical protein